MPQVSISHPAFNTPFAFPRVTHSQKISLKKEREKALYEKTDNSTGVYKGAYMLLCMAEERGGGGFERILQCKLVRSESALAVGQAAQVWQATIFSFANRLVRILQYLLSTSVAHVVL